MDQLAAQNSEIKVVHHPEPVSVGNAFQVRIARAKFDSFVIHTRSLLGKIPIRSIDGRLPLCWKANQT